MIDTRLIASAAGLLLAGLLLVGCQTAAPGAPAPGVLRVLTADGEERRLDEAPAAGAPVLSDAEARQRAARYVPGATADNAPARYVALTLLTAEGDALIRARPVWVVTYEGVPFVTERCVCHGPPDRPNTAVALDAASGELVLIYGLDRARAQ
jgi:hypothetical protein